MAAPRGVPGFFVALASNRRRYVPGFVRQVLRFSVPTGVVTGAAAYVGYAATRWLDPAGGVATARTTATVVVLIVSFWTLAVLARPSTVGKAVLLASMIVLGVVAVAIPAFREDVLLLEPTAPSLLLAGGLGMGGALLVEVVARTVAVEERPADRASGPVPADHRPGVRGSTWETPFEGLSCGRLLRPRDFRGGAGPADSGTSWPVLDPRMRRPPGIDSTS